jgi:F-type H+-transporting ATPase subunit b
MRSWKSSLWIASTPLALTLLLAQPGRAQPHAEAPVVDEAHQTLSHGHEQSHEFLTNPLENFSRFDYRGKDSHGGDMDPGDHPMPAPFMMVLFNFAVFAFIIYRLAGPSIKRVVRDRHETIAKALAESGRLRDEARARLDEYASKMASMDREIDGMVAGIRAEAEAEKRRIIAEAEARAARMQRDAELQIDAELQRVRMLLEREAVEAAVRIAEQLLRDKTSDADQRALTDRFVKGLGEAATKRRPRAHRSTETPT